jgi:hypothetical protein
MGTIVSSFLVVLGSITLIGIVLVSLAAYSYKRLVITFKSTSASPDFKLKPTSVVGSIFSAITGNLASAAGGFINGVRLDGQITCVNNSFVPLYLPDMDHEVSIGGKSCMKMIHTYACWLKPRGSETIPINMTLSTNDIPHVALAGLTHRGVINVEIRSRAIFGHFSYLKITSTTTKIPDYLPKVTKGKNKPPL